MNYKLIADSSADLFTLPGVEMVSVPMKIITAEKEYIDDAHLDVAAMVADLRTVKGKTGTSCPNMQDWLDAFRGGDRIFAVAITSNLSGSCASCTQAAREYEESTPGARVKVIDSLSAGPELALLLQKLHSWIGQGRPFEQICADIDTYMAHTHLSFSLESLANLARNGRVSPAVAKIAGVLGIRLIGVASAEGTLEPRHKVRGEKKAIATLYQDMRDRGYEGGQVRICHCFNLPAAEALRAMIHADFPRAPVAIDTTRGLCSFYAEQGGLLVGYEDKDA